MRFEGSLDIYASTKHIYMSPALNRSSVIRGFKHSNVFKICNRITFDLHRTATHTFFIFTIHLCIRGGGAGGRKKGRGEKVRGNGAGVEGARREGPEG